MNLLKKIASVIVAGAVAVVSVVSAPASVSAVDDVDEYGQYLDTLVSMATGGVLPSGALAVLSAQYALVYAYSQVGAGSNALHGQGHSFGGLTIYQNDVYFGGGYINDTGSVLRFRVTHSNADGGQLQDYTLTGSTYLNEPSLIDSMSVYSRSNVVGNNYYKYSYSLQYNNSFTSRYITSEFNGDTCGVYQLGYTNAPSGYNTMSIDFSPSHWSYCTFYDGGYNFNTGFESLSGTSLLDDLSSLHSQLLQDYPDVDEQYYLDWDYDEPGGGTGCHCDVTVIVEPTINVEVTVENPLPSEWLETIPQETTENPFEEFPTVEIEEYTDILIEPDEVIGENSGLWWYVLENWFKSNDKLWKYLLSLFTIGVIGAILRGLK